MKCFSPQLKWKAWFIMPALWAICCLMDYKLLRSTHSLRSSIKQFPHYCLIILSRHGERLIAVLVNRGIFGHQSLMRKSIIEWDFIHTPSLAIHTHTHTKQSLRCMDELLLSTAIFYVIYDIKNKMILLIDASLCFLSLFCHGTHSKD